MQLKNLFVIGISALVLHSFESLHAQQSSETGPTASPAPSEPLPDLEYDAFGFYDDVPQEPRRKPKVPLAGVTEVHIDSPQPVENYVESVSKSEEEVQDPSALVEVEPEDYVNVPGSKTEFMLVGYKNRRRTFGVNLSVGMSMFRPKMVADNQMTDGTATDYGGVDTNIIEFQVSPRWNLPFGSLSVDLGTGQYYDSAQSTTKTTLTLTMYRVGATFHLDRILSEPYIVPYASAGLYQFNYSEQAVDDESISNSGSTDMGQYVAFGVNIQLNWLDSRSAKIAYNDLGLENGFLFAEGRQLMPTNSLPDFSSTSFDVSGGVRVEF